MTSIEIESLPRGVGHLRDACPVEVRTPGASPNTVTIEAIRLGLAHVTRNPRVYALFNRLGLVTDTGRGVYRAIKRVHEWTGLAPGLSIEGNEFVVSVPLPKEKSQ